MLYSYSFFALAAATLATAGEMDWAISKASSSSVTSHVPSAYGPPVPHSRSAEIIKSSTHSSLSSATKFSSSSKSSQATHASSILKSSQSLPASLNSKSSVVLPASSSSKSSQATAASSTATAHDKTIPGHLIWAHPTQDADTAGGAAADGILAGIAGAKSLEASMLASTTAKPSTTAPPGSKITGATMSVTMNDKSSVHVGTLTSSELYSKISTAVGALCPSVTQTPKPGNTVDFVSCDTGVAKIENIFYFDTSEDAFEMGAHTDGELDIKVTLSSYNTTANRDALIHLAAQSFMAVAAGKNCLTQYDPTSEWEADNPPVRRGLSSSPQAPSLKARSALSERDNFSDATYTSCTTTGDVEVMWYPPYWNRQSNAGTGDQYLAVDMEFHRPPVTPFWCELIEDALGLVFDAMPEMELEGIAVEYATKLACGAIEKDGDSE